MSDLTLPANVGAARAITGHGVSAACCFPGLPGYSSVMVGVLRAMADDYGALVILSHEGQQQDDVDVISIMFWLKALSRKGVTLIWGRTSHDDRYSRTCRAFLETLCPMFLLVDDKTARIQQAGPTLQKLRPELQPMTGQGLSGSV